MREIINPEAPIMTVSRVVLPNAETLDTDDLIDGILDRFHATHRADLPLLITAARAAPDAPDDLASLIVEAGEALEAHMLKEEGILFPMMRAGGHPAISCPITRMREEHTEHEIRVARLDVRRNRLDPGSTLELLLAKFLDDLRQHVRVENDILFPRFVPIADAAA